MKTKILVVGDNNTLLHTKLLDVLEGNPEYLVVYVNQDNLDTIDGIDYDTIICDELVDLGMIEKRRGITICGNINVGTIGQVDWSDEIIPICPTGHKLMFDTLPDLDYTPVNTKHVKPFYHKGRW